MNYLNYYSHIILNSKYKIFINLFVYIVLYIFIKNSQLVYCMVNESDSGSHLTIFKTQIEEFAQSAQTIEDQSIWIEDQRQRIFDQASEIKHLKETINLQRREINEFYLFKKEVEKQIVATKSDLNLLQSGITFISNHQDYIKSAITKIEKNINSIK